ncbi:MAG: hypothetical protein ATN36_07185 [Epulopiscium sp. Nele67-Bin005]|nr:MAG: hypothetical protein ATN36_07185 [Epulopiscium sp. Nele67-Bin005]
MLTNTKTISLLSHEITEITITNDNQMSISVLTLGGIITKILLPTDDNKLENVVLAYKDYNNYLNDNAAMGAIIGRTAGRIYKGKVEIDGVEYNFKLNNGSHSLHGGENGFNSKIWNYTIIKEETRTGIELTYFSQDGEEGYPANVDITVIYWLDNDNNLKIEYFGTTDKTTLLNLTNHSYFNLSGDVKTNILNHNLKIDSHIIAELDNENIPTGHLINISNIPTFNFLKTKSIGEHITTLTEFSAQKGYDHPWILNPNCDLVFSNPNNNRKMTMTTNYDAVVIYSANFSTGFILDCDKKFEDRDGICFEAQNLPIGYNECNKERSILTPDKPYNYFTNYKFEF